ncbi:MAG TPA: hypothetical protein VGV38_08975, partial [Pyrinomonadaceae bacterium]|nr:hypothetical protein [Pyrinomonadaceae bacterium]
AGQTPACTPAEFNLMRLSDVSQKAFSTLTDVKFFAVGGVGYSAETSEGEKALRTLLREPEAAEAFKSLLSRANPEGRLYALLGLRFADRYAYNKARTTPEPPLRDGLLRGGFLKLDAGMVRVMEGCVGGTRAWKDILKEIDAGRYDWSFEPPPPRGNLTRCVRAP